MRENKVQFMTQAAMIAAIYVVLCIVFEPISYGAIQTRVAEALTVLPFFTPAAVPGLFIGCLVANLLGGGILLDVAFGSVATLKARWERICCGRRADTWRRCRPLWQMC